MNAKISTAWDKLRCFCAEQTVNFYVGMALAVLMILNLNTLVPIIAGAALCPFASAVFYLMLRALKQSPTEWRGDKDVPRSALAAFLGGLYAIILTLL